MQKKIAYFLYTNFRIVCALRCLLWMKDAVNDLAPLFYVRLKAFTGKAFSLLQEK